jgi:hypothetical protein
MQQRIVEARKRFDCETIAHAALGEPTKRVGADLLWSCPNHEDRHPSLAINPAKDVFLCAPCNASGTAWQFAAFLARLDAADKLGVTAWLKERGVFSSKQRGKPPKNTRGAVVAEYIYRDAGGSPIARKLRFEPGRDGRKKDFAWQRWENGAWTDGLSGLRLPLYRLVEIQNEPCVVLTEGEKDADVGAQHGLPTATSGGVGSFREDHADALRGKDCLIIPDADDAGRAYAQQVALMLHGKAESVKVCEIPHAKDLAEAIEKGMTADGLFDLFEKAPEWVPAEGRELLDSVMRFTRRFVELTEAQARATAIWTAHTHAMDAADCTAYLHIKSAAGRCGKTRFLEVEELLVANPWKTGRSTTAALIRKIDAKHPTLLLDESDTAFGGEKEYAETLRGILNTGYQRGGASSCCVGEGANMDVKDFSTFCAKAIAGIGKLPDTVADRSIPIGLKRARRRQVERFRVRDARAEAAPIKARLAAWCKDNVESLRSARPEIPDALSDRQADCCEPLLAIADLAGGEWPEAARRALVELCGESEADDQSAGVRLLSDIRDVFDGRGVDRLGSAELAEALAEIETSPWSEWSRGKPLTAPKLARILSAFGVTPGTIRLDNKTVKGYYRRDCEDSFARYIPLSKGNNVTRPINIGGNADSGTVTDTPCDGTENTENPNSHAGCDVVTVSNPGEGGAYTEKGSREPGDDGLFDQAAAELEDDEVL